MSEPLPVLVMGTSSGSGQSAAAPAVGSAEASR